MILFSSLSCSPIRPARSSSFRLWSMSHQGCKYENVDSAAPAHPTSPYLLAPHPHKPCLVDKILTQDDG